MVRIGCWAAFWGDTPFATRQVLRVDDLDYLVGDHLAEITMALLARARAKDPEAGYVPDAVDALSAILPEIAERGIRVVTNAGALNPVACAAALQRAADEAGLQLRVAAVVGDDLTGEGEAAVDDWEDMFTGRPVAREPSSMNAYLGARPIAVALGAGADVVVTGRCADAAVVLGPLMHEFGWADDDFDLLAAGMLVGHLVECGPQVTGGLHADWDAVGGWEDMGFPVAECRADGTAVITKPAGTGGLITPATVGAQLVYEISDPGAYLGPDVISDWRRVGLEQAGPDRVEVSGARGSAPTTSYKVTATHRDGYRAMTTALFAGVGAGGRARRAAEAIVARTNHLLDEAGHGPLREHSIEVVGTGDVMGDGPRDDALEAVMKLGVRHDDRAALELFAREVAPMALVAMGMTGFVGGRPRPAPVFAVHHLRADRARVPVTVRLGEETIAVDVAPGDPGAATATPTLPEGAVPAAEGVTVPLARIAYARSGDKGDSANIAFLARRPELAAVLREQVNAARVGEALAHLDPGPIRRWELPGLHAVNVVVDGVLGGCGGTSSLRFDPQGKSYAAMLLTLPVTVPAELLAG